MAVKAQAQGLDSHSLHLKLPICRKVCFLGCATIWGGGKLAVQHLSCTSSISNLVNGRVELLEFYSLLEAPTAQMEHAPVPQVACSQCHASGQKTAAKNTTPMSSRRSPQMIDHRHYGS